MKVLLKNARQWLHFSNPIRVLQADDPADVLPMLKEAEESGLYAAGFISYEAATAFDEALKTKSSDGFPLLQLGLFNAPEILGQIEEPNTPHYTVGTLEPSVEKAAFVEAIASIKYKIAAGATYQANYTYRLCGDFSGDAYSFFYELVKDQRAEQAAFIETPEFTVCSASPELFFSAGKGRILSRPMKGTARRGRTFSEDWKQSEALHQSEKDRAENIMIVDMIRNDIGRIAEPGSVETISTYDVEKYPTVWQMTSTVQGKLKPRIDANGRERVSEILQALFPCASITGAPKAKTMEIIRDLETSPRKIYTGAIGFMTPQREANFNVAIRTALIQNGQLEFGVGGGIVWDSDAEEEYEETLTKARVLTEPRPEFKLLETMRWEPESGIYLLNEHMQRLGRSAAYFDIPLNMHAVFQGMENLGDKRLRVRLLVSRDGNSEIQTFPLERDEVVASTISVAIAKASVDSQNVFLFHKTTNRTVYEKAKSDFSDADDVILWNEKGEVTESTMANVVVRANGKQLTPPVECGLLAGTFREHLLKLGEIEEAVVTVDMLKSAEEIFLINSVRKWMPVQLVTE